MTEKNSEEALRLADELEEPIPKYPAPTALETAAAAELRRQFDEIKRLHEANQAMLDALKGLCGDRVYDYHFRAAHAAIANAEGITKREQQT